MEGIGLTGRDKRLARFDQYCPRIDDESAQPFALATEADHDKTEAHLRRAARSLCCHYLRDAPGK